MQSIVKIKIPCISTYLIILTTGWLSDIQHIYKHALYAIINLYQFAQ